MGRGSLRVALLISLLGAASRAEEAPLDLDKIARRVRRLLAVESSSGFVTDMSPAALRTTLFLTGPRAIKRAVAALKEAKIVLVPGPPATLTRPLATRPHGVARLMLCRDAQGAAVLFETEVLNSKRTDKALSGEGSSPRILSARYEDMQIDGAPAVIGSKLITDWGERQTRGFAFVRDGDLVFELAGSVFVSERGIVLRKARRVLELIRAARAPSPWTDKKGREAMTAFIDAHDDPAWGVRWRAVRNLGRIRLPSAAVAPALRRALKDADHDVRLAALSSLARRVGLTEEERKTAERDPDWEVRATALKLRADDLTPEQLPALRRALEDPHAEPRRLAYVGLADAGLLDQLAWEDVGPGTQDRDPGVRRAALDAVTLTHIERNREEAGRVLIAAARDDDERIRELAVDLLEHVGPTVRGVVPALVEALEDESFSVRIDAVYALMDFGPPAAPAIPALLRMLDKNELRQPVVRTLGKIGAPAKETIPRLRRDLEDGNLEYQFEVARALWRLGAAPGPLQPAIVEVLRRGGEYDRGNAAELLGEMGESAREYIPELIRALGDTSEAPRRESAEALGKMGAAARPALPALRKLARNDDEARVRRAAAKAIKKIEDA